MLYLFWFSIIIFVLIVFIEGATELLVKSEFFSWFRNLISRIPLVGIFLYKLFSCGMCTSVWVSIMPALFVAGSTNPVSNFVENYYISFVIWLVFLFRASNHFHNFCDKFLDKFYSRKHFSGNPRSYKE